VDDTLAAFEERWYYFWGVEVQRGASKEFVKTIPGQPTESSITEDDLPLQVDDVERVTEGVQNLLIQFLGPREPGQDLTKAQRGGEAFPRPTSRRGAELWYLLVVPQVVCSWCH
jgi:hypothetical protein